MPHRQRRVGCMVSILALASTASAALRGSLSDVAATSSRGVPVHSVSGQSAGGSMAMQHLFAFSSLVEGACVAAGSPYGCGALVGRATKCYDGGSNIERLNEYVGERYEAGLIDDPTNIKNIPTLLFSGTWDWVVSPKCMHDVRKQLLAFVQPPTLSANFQTQATHVWPIDNGDCQCGDCLRPGETRTVCCDVNNCGYDMSGDMFRRIYSARKQPKALLPRQTAVSNLSTFNQTLYTPPGNITPPGVLLGRPRATPEPQRERRSGLYEIGYAYVPAQCRDKPSECDLHVNYHGCIAAQLWRRDLWMDSINLNEYAEANGIVVLYPQAKGTEETGTGCWNWAFRRDDPYFDTKLSMQLGMVANVLKDIDNALVPPATG